MKSYAVALVLAILALSSCGKKHGARNAPAQSGAETPATTVTATGTPVVVYQDGEVRIASLDGGDVSTLFDGYDAEIAPGGKMIAFTSYGKEGSRSIAIYDIATKNVRILSRPPGENNYGPRWSTDAKKLVFNHFNGKDWLPAIVDAGDSECRILGRASQIGDMGSGLYSPCWGPSDKSVYCQNLDSMFCFETSGKLLWKRSMNEIMGVYADSVSGSSATTFVLHPDGKSLLIGISDIEGTLGLAFTLDTKTFAVRRIGPRDYHIMQPVWTPGGEDIVFSGCKLTKSTLKRIRYMEEVPMGIFISDPAGANVRAIAANGSSPTCAFRTPK